MLNFNWHPRLAEELNATYMVKLLNFLKTEIKSGKTIYPNSKNVFNAFKNTKFEDVKVVILGQDPYHGPNQAHGLSFSVLPGVRTPPSLINIYKELNSDLSVKIPKHGNLSTWANQGVLLLNSVLTVEAGQAGSHQKLGWQKFTDLAISLISRDKENCVFVLWGAYAQKKKQLINNKKHLILESVHPSPLSAHRGFLGCKHFSKINEYLIKNSKKPINWELEYATNVA